MSIGNSQHAETAAEHCRAPLARSAHARVHALAVYVDGVQTLSEGDEVAVLPPVSGG